MHNVIRHIYDILNTLCVEIFEAIVTVQCLPARSTPYFDTTNFIGFMPHVQHMLLHLQNVIFFD